MKYNAINGGFIRLHLRPLSRVFLFHPVELDPTLGSWVGATESNSPLFVAFPRIKGQSFSASSNKTSIKAKLLEKPGFDKSADYYL